MSASIRCRSADGERSLADGIIYARGSWPAATAAATSPPFPVAPWWQNPGRKTDARHIEIVQYRFYRDEDNP